MNHKLFHIGGNLSPKLSFVGNSRSGIFPDRNPNLLASLHHNTLCLNCRFRILIGVYNHILNKVRHPDIVPSLCQRFHGLTGPGCKGVGAIVGPCPQVGRIPAIRHFHDHRYHLVFLLGKSRQRQARYCQHKCNENSDCLFHRFSLLLFLSLNSI